MATATLNLTLSVGGVTVQGTVVRTAEGQISQDVSLPAADIGTLSTRTNDTDGELTMTEGDHVINTGDVIDIFWTDGSDVERCAYGATVGTVNATAVPFTGASGDVLPTQDYAITADVLIDINVDFDGDDVEIIALQSTRQGHFDFQDVSNASLAEDQLKAGEPWFWAKDTGASNPLTGNPVDSLLATNGNGVNAATLKLGVLYDSVP